MLMNNQVGIEALKLKLSAKSISKNFLLSMGGLSNKLEILPHLKKLIKYDINLYATIGTHKFLGENGVKSTLIYKIRDQKKPNIYDFLEKDKFDLAINILTGIENYDRESDNNIIREMCINNSILLITSTDVFCLTIEKLINKNNKNNKKINPWDMKSLYEYKVINSGGYSCHHAHFDKAYIINEDNLKLSQTDMQYKWKLYKFIKENYTYKDLYKRMSMAAEVMIKQGIVNCRTFVDADSTIKLLAIEVALEIKNKYKNEIYIEIAVQPLEGVLNKKSRYFFEKACELADVVGGLPSRDRPEPEKHLDFILSLAKSLGKPVDVHIDQENNPDESESELLALKTIEHGMQGKVRGIHAISLAAKPYIEQIRIARLLKKAGITIIICPSAAISMKQLEKSSPLHNSIAPLKLLLKEEVPVCLGIDNIHDLFMPLVDGDMWFESRLLMESTRLYDLDIISKIATNSVGFLNQNKDYLTNK